MARRTPRLDEVEGHWLNLEPLITADPGLELGDFYPQALAPYRRQGRCGPCCSLWMRTCSSSIAISSTPPGSPIRTQAGRGITF